MENQVNENTSASAGKDRALQPGQVKRLVPYRRDQDRDVHIKRLQRLASVMEDCPERLVPQTLRAMLRAHKALGEARSELRTRAESWRETRLEAQAAQALAYKALLYVAEEARKPPPRRWDAEPPDEEQLLKRYRFLLDGKAPSELRHTPAALKGALERLARILAADREEASRWSEDLVSSVGPLARRLGAAIAAENLAAEAHDVARLQLQRARSWWDFLWDHTRRLVTGHIRVSGGDERYIRAFRPVRYRPLSAADASSPAEEPEDAEPGPPTEPDPAVD